MRSDIIDKIRKTVSKTARKAAKVSGDTIDYTKLKIKLYDIKDKLDDDYAEIGRLVYDGEDSACIEAICDDISKLREQEEEIREKLNSYRNKKICNMCGETVDSDSEYCPFCGNKL